MESVYWVITRDCTQQCDHCYISSGPGEQSLPERDIELIVENLPETVNRVILGGGETLVVESLLYKALDMLCEKFGDGAKLMIQTNGDLLNERTVDELLARRICRFDVSSMDDFHRNRRTRDELARVFESNGVQFLEFPNFTDEEGNIPHAAYSFWGSTPDLWLGGIWPRGRALANNVWTKDPAHNFCGIWSGAAGFLDNGTPQQEVNIRLNQVFPCCPATLVSLGDVTEEPLLDILDRYRGDPVFEALNRGEPECMGISQGLSVEFAKTRIRHLGSCCLWCDEFFEKYYQR